MCFLLIECIFLSVFFSGIADFFGLSFRFNLSKLITSIGRCTGFKLEFKQDGVTVSRSFTYTAVGYGKEIIV